MVLEVGMAGGDGTVGIPITLGVRRTQVRAQVDGAGTATRDDHLHKK